MYAADIFGVSLNSSAGKKKYFHVSLHSFPFLPPAPIIVTEYSHVSLPLSPVTDIKKEKLHHCGSFEHIARVGIAQHREDNILEGALRMISPRNYLVNGKALTGNSDRIFFPIYAMCIERIDFS